MLLVGADEGFSTNGNAVKVWVVLDENDLVPKGAANGSSPSKLCRRGVAQYLRWGNSGSGEFWVDGGNGVSGIFKLLLVIGACPWGQGPGASSQPPLSS